jgi:hypothetical protein
MIPDPKVRRWFDRKAIVEALSVVPPIAAGVVTGLLALSDRAKTPFGIVLLASAGWLALASCVKVLHAHRQDRDHKQSDEHDGLRAALYVLHGIVSAAGGDCRLRVTVHRVVPRKKGNPAEELEQLLPYVGGRGGSGRTFSIRSGIIGRAAREQKLIAASRQLEDWEAFVAELVRTWGYTDAEARARTTDRRSWCAVPILDRKQETAAVVYLDSDLPDYFTDDVQDLIAASCRGITTYITERY